MKRRKRSNGLCEQDLATGQIEGAMSAFVVMEKKGELEWPIPMASITGGASMTA